ncbi:unnamed protein product [Meganyctiphanes norvegica]|uniref:Uncharacterized protein n=1 Tax=Meganyctiphanes norvegica TaxID=48144 RepID=A0AAV2RUF4_MEGNR
MLDNASAIMTQVDSSLRFLGFDLQDFIKNLDIQTVGLFTLVVVAGVFLFDFLGYGYSTYQGTTSAYSSYSRSLTTGAAKFWQNREILGFDPYLNEIRGGRSLDSVTGVLDAISSAWLKYEDPVITNRITRAVRYL